MQSEVTMVEGNNPQDCGGLDCKTGACLLR